MMVVTFDQNSPRKVDAANPCSYIHGKETHVRAKD